MASRTRRPSSFLPTIDAMDARIAASNLSFMAGLLASAIAPSLVDLAIVPAKEDADDESGEDRREDEAVLTTIASAQPGGAPAQSRPGVEAASVSPSNAPTPYGRPRPADPASQGLEDEDGLLASAIITLSPATSHPVSSLDAVQQPTAPDDGNAPVAPAQQPGRRGGIRPLSQAPPQAQSTEGAASPTGFGSISALPSVMLDEFDDPSGGNELEDLNPEMNMSGGGTGLIQDLDPNNNNKPIPGHYHAANPVPIGSMVNIWPTLPTADGYIIYTYEWGGGTDYASYTSDSPVTTITGEQYLWVGVEKDEPGYSFIVDSRDQHEYTITLHVEYANGKKGDSVVKFTSTKPTSSLVMTQPGAVGVFDQGPGGVAGVALSPAVIFQASSSTDAHTSGMFMFMQIIYSDYQQITFADNSTEFIKNDFDWTDHPVFPGGNFAGPIHDHTSLAYQFTYSGTTDTGRGWFLPPNNSMPTSTSGTPEMRDTPGIAKPHGIKRAQLTSQFETYLMYRPVGGVWIALQRIDWSVDITGTWDATIQRLKGDPHGQPVSTAYPPEGDAAFPWWVNSVGNYMNPELNHRRSGNPGP
jgi:hypothetical protein